MQRCVLAIGVLSAMFANSASAYNLFGPYPWGDDATYYEKWGDIFTVGEPAGTITWSIIPDGTPLDPSFPDPNITGTSSLGAILSELGEAEAVATIERVLAKWSTAANIYFVQVSDSGEPVNSAGAQPRATGQIRFGAFEITGTTGAVGYAPFPGGESREGDVLLNSNNTFFFDPGGEGDPIQIFNDLESLLLHEVGHALGMAHSDVCAVMSADFNCFQYVNRELDPDDIAGIEFLYGPAVKSDFDHDNYATAADLAVWETHFGSTTATAIAGDATGEGLVSGDDFLLWQREYAPPPAELAATPEPTSALLATLAWVGLGLRRFLTRSAVRTA
ncbi:MAG: matrixin family metalloprotease [Planctomycetales bacterium]|nr:matrixin family metalloprotease [Planctomycetales bacterium]